MQHKHDRTPEQIERVARLAEADPERMQVVKTQIIGGPDDLPSPRALVPDHAEYARGVGLARPCSATDLFLSSGSPTGTQCGNCLWPLLPRR